MNATATKISSISLIVLAAGLLACSTPPQAPEVVTEVQVEEITYDTNNPKSIIEAVEKSSGTWNKLWEQKDVEFTFNYKYPESGKEDVSMERYVFDSEQSWAKYSTHQINVMPDAEGVVVQYYDGSKVAVQANGAAVESPEAIGGAEFLRKANYFWFVMMFKLNNPGALYEYIGSETMNGIAYDKVKVTYDAGVTGKELNDTYVVYVNPKTKMVDQFYFSLPIMGVTEPVIRMELAYEEINGLMIPTKRSVFMPSENGYSTSPNLVQTYSNVKFNNGFTDESFMM